ncbi:putative transporter [Prevotella sp.]|jgi:putative transport protein|uniref:putative transporter n=1 Tax=Prevotella sp. TaxID=59823 RepID=UPI0025FE3984|nr:putative transporter [Prevotella sp.]MBD9245884.1 putative transporter [Prevotella sp.]
MDWINSLFIDHTPVQTCFLLSLIVSIGVFMGKVRIKGISLGVAFVFFMGIVAGSLHLEADPGMTSFAETFGLSIFVYALGLHVGPNFVGLMRDEGIALNLWGFAIILLGTVMALVLCLVTGITIPDMVGILCGATTNTPALGAAQQALISAHVSSSGAALGCAVTYPLGVVGVIFAMILLRKTLVKPEDLIPHSHSDEDNTYIGQFVVVNPAIVGLTIAEIAQTSQRHFIISRIWRNGKVIVPMAQTVMMENDNILVVTTRDEVPVMDILFGKHVEKDWNRDKIDWNAIDSTVESRVIVMTRTKLNSKTLGSLHMRETYGVNVSRIMRGDIKLLATDSLHLQYGDRLTVVGTPEDIDHAEAFLGNAMGRLNEPNLGAIFFGLLMGLALGMIPISLPGMSSPVKLGIAGGPIIMGIIVGALGSRLRIITYTTRSASLMLRKLGLSLYLACLGLSAGKDFLSTVVRPEGLMWVGIGLVLTMLPLLIIGAVALKTKKFDFGTICGLLCGAMANPMALSYANETIKGDRAAVAYTSVYPLGMFIRVVIAQIIIMTLVC